jgi:hypothetical protein
VQAALATDLLNRSGVGTAPSASGAHHAHGGGGKGAAASGADDSTANDIPELDPVTGQTIMVDARTGQPAST